MEPPPTTTKPFIRPTDKPPLVTPSASPPPFRHNTNTAPRIHRQGSWIGSENGHAQNHVQQQQQHQDKRYSFLNNNNNTSSSSSSNNRAFGSVPPTKRAPSRAASTPRPPGGAADGGGRGGFRSSSTASFASASGSSSTRQNGVAATEEPIDIHKERQASIMRLLDAWSQLDKHVKRLDEDDIVHLGTGKIIKDTGVLRGLKAVRFGDHAEEEDVEDEEEEDEEEGEEDEDEEEDQLDTLRSEDVDGEEEEEELEIRVQAPTANVPPVTQANLQDAEDLRAFLEVEKDIGTEPEDDPEEVLDDAYEDTGASSEVQDDLDQGEEEDEGETGAEEEEIPGSAPSGPEESDSEDELNCNWAEDEASVVIPVEAEVIELDDEDEDDVIEIIEPTLPPQPPKESRNASKAPKTKAQLQLYTPPLSRGSEQTPPDDDYATPPPVELPPPDISPEIPIGFVYQPKPAPVHPFLLSPSSKAPSKSVLSSSVPHTNSFISHQKKGKERESTAVPAAKRKFKLKAEVVIERRTPFQETKPSKKESKQTSEAPTPASSSGKSKEKGKGKREKAVVDATTPEDGVGEVAPPEKKPSKKASASLAKAKSDSSSKEIAPKKAKAKMSFPSTEEVVESAQPKESSPPPSPRKRKRSSTGKAPTPQVNAVASSSKVKLDHGSEDETTEPSKSSKDARRSVHQRSPRKPKSKSRSRQPSTSSESEDGGPHSDSGGEDRRHYRHHSSRPGTFPPPPFHPYSFAHPSMYPLPPQSASSAASGSSASTSHHHGVFPPAPPMPNHQTQFIVSQVMQQLTAMATGHWGPMPGIPPPHPHARHHPQSSSPEHPPQHGGYGPGPFTPTHQHQNYRRSKSKGAPGAPGSGYEYEGYGGSYEGDPYSTPTHHHHHRGGYPMYPYMFNPDMSRGTAPPDTPEHALGSSSSVAGSSPAMLPNSERARKKNLVERSRSRGRRVSFKAGNKKNKGKGREASSDEEEDDRMDVFASSPLARRRKGSWEGEEMDHEDDRKKGEGKSKDTSSNRTTGSRSTGKSLSDVEAEKGKKKKGKQRICSPEEVEGDASGSGSEGSDSDDVPLSRGRGFVRGQTPGPPVNSTSRATSKK